jgi:Cu2+-containing amine oxidase
VQVNKYFQPKSSIIMNNELAINEQSNLIASVQTVMKTAPEVLNANKLSVQNAVKASHAMLDTIEASGMNDEIDEAVNNLQVKLKKTQAKINEARTPITQMLTLISKEFTTLEKPLDPNNKEGVYYLLQQHRNAFAQTKAINQRKKQEEADRKMRIAQERIDIRAKIKSAAMATFSEHLLSKKMELQALMDALTLQNWASRYSMKCKTFQMFMITID